MNSILKRLRKLGDDELLGVSKAIDCELERRLEHSDLIPDSARRRAVRREQSYRRCTGSSAVPVKYVGMQRPPKRRLAA